MMERCTSGADRSDETASAVFFIVHLAGEKQDRMSPQPEQKPMIPAV